MSVEVSVVVVSYNSGAHLPSLFRSVREHTHGVTYETILVDNASTDRATEAVAHDYPWVCVLHRPFNGGLSLAINDGVTASSGRFVAVLNPDVTFDHDVLAGLAAFLRDHPDVGIVAPKLLNPDGSVQLSCRAFPGYTTALFSRYSLFTRILPGNRYSRRYLMADFDHATTRDVDWVSGAALMFTRELFDRIGGWDPGFFLFSEDVDFCKRAHDAGSRVVYYPEVRVYHTIGISERAPARVIVERHRSMWRYYRKHLRGNRLQDAVTAAAIAARCLLMLATSALRRLRSRGESRA